MDDVKVKAMELAISHSPGSSAGALVVEAKRIEEYLRGEDSTDNKPAKLPDTYLRCETADGKAYDKHSIPPFMRKGEPASPALPVEDIYDIDAMAKRGEGVAYDEDCKGRGKIKSAYGMGILGNPRPLKI